MTRMAGAYIDQFIKYAGVGALAAAVDIGALYALTEHAGVFYLVSAVLSFCLGVAVNYGLSTRFIFKKRRMESRRREFAVFLAIGVLGLGLNTLLIWLLTEHAGLFYLHSKYIATGVVFFFNFNARKFILFN